MNVVCDINANAAKNTLTPVVFVRGKQVHYDADTINQLFHLQYISHGLDDLAILVESTNMEEITNEICGGGTKWNIVKGEDAYFPSNDLHQNMKV